MIKFRRHSGIYTLETEQFVPISIEKAWEFFSSPENLCLMTPPHMNFRITSGQPEKMYVGQMISYTLSPFPGTKTNWVTEITVSEPPNYFVDEQRFGPYKMWHHEHRFEPANNGIRMIDKVTYKLPFHFLGCIAHTLFVKGQLRDIFSFRKRILEQRFLPDNTK